MLTDIAIIILAALLGHVIFGKMGLPGILGMIAAGILLGPSGFDLIEPEVLGMLKHAKTVALIVILIRAGLGISKETLHRIGGPAIRMGFVPALVEGTAVTAGSYYLLGLPFFESGMLGFIMAAVRQPSDRRTLLLSLGWLSPLCALAKLALAGYYCADGG
ncbi:MAG: cation:proton antiporter domain-containing protein [Planctomycetota bacterium]|jgi:NhaP-type Na+/H+ or K+/H+ antiporter